VNRILPIFIVLISFFGYSQKNYYVSQDNGNDVFNGSAPTTPFKTIDHAVDLLEPGDTLNIMGSYTNESYKAGYAYGGDKDDPYIWTQENTIRIAGLHGSEENYITIRAYDDNTVIKGDGANIFRMLNSSYIRIEGLNIAGEVNNIPLETATALQFMYREDGSTNTLYRVQPGTPPQEVEQMTFEKLNNISRPSYTDTRGMYLSNVDHIEIINNHIHHTPGNGLRVSDCEYITISENEVNDTSRKSYSGTHGLVVTKATSTNASEEYKIFITNNAVHHNYNEIYSWAPDKTIITPHIDEGKGISLQRNDVERGWVHGRFLVANNIVYLNGFSGVHSNDGDRMDFVNNTCYLNSYTNTVTYKNGEQRGNNIGMSSQRGDDIRFVNNIVVIDESFGGYALAMANTANGSVMNNLIYGLEGEPKQDSDVQDIQTGTMVANPLFRDVDAFDFTLMEDSPAIGSANVEYAPAVDYFLEPRDDMPDLGAIEFNASLGLEGGVTANPASIYPNPFNNRLYITSGTPLGDIRLYDFNGRLVKRVNVMDLATAKETLLDLSDLSTGPYLLLVNGKIYKVIKQ
tara:strand:- start:701 stop:2419 length:1719 start_codon:yes stop_codon:yes gene_type:complete